MLDFAERPRIVHSVLMITIEEEPGALDVGSCVHVRLGGRDFAFTAGHNVWSKHRDERMKVAIGRPSEILNTFQTPGDGSVGRVFLRQPTNSRSHPDPDVAVIEFSDRTIVSGTINPFSEEEIGSPTDTRISSAGPTAIIAGIPAERVEKDLAPMPDGARVTKGMLTMNPHSFVLYLVDSLDRNGATFPNEPAPFRGLIAFVPDTATTATGDAPIPVPQLHGMSGGPMVTRDAGLLVGVLRSRIDVPKGAITPGSLAWYEPIVECVRLLLDHDDPQVVNAARRVTTRLDAGAQEARRRD